MIRGIIFDADGTLLDSSAVFTQLDENWLFLRSLEKPPLCDETLKTMSMPEGAAWLAETCAPYLTQAQVMDELTCLLKDSYEWKVREKPGAGRLLETCRLLGLRCCICTATRKSLIESCLKRLGLLEYFEFILTCEEAGCSKHDSALYEAALKKLDLKKEEVLVFEDALHAVKTAAGAGFRTVVIEDLEYDDFLAASQIAEASFHSPLEACDYIKTVNKPGCE